MTKRILFYEPHIQLHAKVISLFMEKGFEIVIIKTIAQIIEELQTDKYNILICDNSDESTLSLVSDIKSIEGLKSTHIIICMEVTHRALLTKVLDLGVCGVIKKPFTQRSLVDDFVNIVKRLNLDIIEKRKHIRIEPLSSDNASFDFRDSKSYQLVKGKVINISMGGVLCTFQNSDFEIPLKQVIENIHVKLGENLFTANAFLVAKKENYYAFQFHHIPPVTKAVIANYIYKISNK